MGMGQNISAAIYRRLDTWHTIIESLTSIYWLKLTMQVGTNFSDSLTEILTETSWLVYLQQNTQKTI